MGPFLDKDCKTAASQPIWVVLLQFYHRYIQVTHNYEEDTPHIDNHTYSIDSFWTRRIFIKIINCRWSIRTWNFTIRRNLGGDKSRKCLFHQTNR